jgi:hypothetical protein
MSSSVWLYAFMPPDEKWQKMAKVYFACQEAKIEPPYEVQEYFEDGPPEPHGKEVALNGIAREYKAEMHWGMEIDVDKIPKDATMIRFYIAY